MLTSVLLALPWALPFVVLILVRQPRELPISTSDRTPRVSVIVPARNEAPNIERVLSSLTASAYPDFEIIVVDDRSEDDTGALARRVDRGRAACLEVVDGEPLPEGWMGKPWACWQGSHRAQGELLLFTDADTVHGPNLLGRAVAGLEQTRADALTVMGRQLMGSFWERLVQPQIFMLLMIRYRDLSRPFQRHCWRSAVANGQFILIRRETYLAIGGHSRVRNDVVEDLRLAQHLVREGHALVLRAAEDDFATRMYRSLSELVAGWSKNVVLGSRQTLPPPLALIAPPAMIATITGFWLAPPPLLVVAGLLGDTGLLVWSVAVVGLSVLFWTIVASRFGAPLYAGLLYALGAGVVTYIILRSWIRMRSVEWKGRRYRLGPGSGQRHGGGSLEEIVTRVSR